MNSEKAAVLTVIALVAQVGNQYAGIASLLVLFGNTAYFLVAASIGVKQGYDKSKVKSDEATIIIDGQPVTGKIVSPKTESEEPVLAKDTKPSFGSHFYRFTKYLPMAYLGYLFLVSIGFLN